MKRLLVTGGAGFIGSNFVRYWLRQHPADRLINLDALTYAGNLENLADVQSLPNYRFVQGDIGDRALVERLFRDERIDTVVNFAAESHVDRSILGPDAFIQTNINGTFNLLEVARAVWNGQESRWKSYADQHQVLPAEPDQPARRGQEHRLDPLRFQTLKRNAATNAG